MQLRHQEAHGQVVLVENPLFVEVGCGVGEVGSTVAEGLTMIEIGSGRGVDVNLGAAMVALLGIVLRSIDADLLDELRRRRGQTVAVGTVHPEVLAFLTAPVEDWPMLKL